MEITYLHIWHLPGNCDLHENLRHIHGIQLDTAPWQLDTSPSESQHLEARSQKIGLGCGRCNVLSGRCGMTQNTNFRKASGHACEELS